MAKRLSWAVRIERAEKRGKFLGMEHDWAQAWNTCAVGEKRNFPKTEEHVMATYTEQEEALGMEFMYAVESDDIPEARRLYVEIMALP